MEFVTQFSGRLTIKLIVFTIIIIIVSIYLFEYLRNKFRVYNTVKNFSGPKAYPLIGNMHLLLGDMSDITQKLINLTAIYESPWRLWIGPVVLTCLDDPEQIEIILNSSDCLEKSKLYEHVKPILGNSLSTAPVTIWKSHRGIVNQIFKINMYLTYTESTIKNSIRLVKILETFDEKEIDISPYLCLCTMDIVFDSLFGMDFNFQNDPECKLHDYIADLSDIGIEKICKFWLHLDFIFYNLPIGKRSIEALSYVNNITTEVIKKYKESRREKESNPEFEEKDAGKSTTTLLDCLFKSYDDGKYTEQDIRDEINSMIFAGSATTSCAMSFAFLMLANFPEIQEKVYEELYQMYGSSDPENHRVIYKDFHKMKYLERVIKETLRLFPPVPFIGRNLLKDTKVSKNITIPKHCIVMIMIYALHRNEKYWKEPLVFDPDRFLPDNYNSKHFIAFSSGGRNCIGQKVAMQEMIGIISTVLRRFIIVIDQPVNIEEIRIKFGITMKPAKPFLLRFKRRY